MKLILVRHGESKGNDMGIAQGWDDSPLTDKGVRQAELVSERLKGFDNFLVRRKTDPDAMVPNGESFRMLMERVKQALNEICERHRTGNVVIVLHGGSTRAAVWALGAMDMKESMSHTFGNTALTEIEMINGKAKIVCLNCTKHIV